MSYIEAERLWHYSAADVWPEGFTKTNAGRVFVFRLPRLMFRRGARFLSDIRGDDWSLGMFEQTLFICELVQRMRYQLANNPNAELEAFFEVVEADTACHSSGRVAYRHPSQFNSLEELLHEQLHNERLDIFLPDIPEVDVAEYRIWVRYKDLTPLDCIRDMMADAERRVRGNTANQVSTPRSVLDSLRESLQPFERWMVISSPEVLTMWYDNYMGRECLSTQERMARASLPSSTSEAQSAEDVITHPLHPLVTFNTVYLFEYQDRQSPVCEIQRNRRSYGLHVPGDLTFPKPKNVLKMSPAMLKPELMYNKYLPDIQKGLIVIDDSPLSNCTTRLRRSIMPQYIRQSPEDSGVDHEADLQVILGESHPHIQIQFDQLPVFDPRALCSSRVELKKHKVQAVQHLTDLDRIRLLSQADMAVLNKERRVSLTSYRTQYLAHQAWVFEEFEASVLHDSSNVSDTARIIIRKIVDTPLLDTPRSLLLYDRELDIFGNMVTFRLEAYEQLLFVYAAHRQLFIFSMGMLDAYRYGFNLHFNALAIGKSNTSKSYLFDLMEQCSVEGSIQTYSYQTLKADASNVNQNDTVTIMNEFSLRSVCDSEKGAGDVTTPEALMKEKLTSMKVRAKVLEIEDGVRQTNFTLSECIGCWFGATNDDPTQVSESFGSRFHWTMFHMIDRPGKNIVDLADAWRRLPGEQQEKIQQYQDWLKQLQCLHWLVEKLIMVGGLHEVSLTATITVVNHVNNYLLAHNVQVHNRIFERIKIQARLLTIHLALHYLYFVPLKILSPDGRLVDNFYGQPFELEQLKFIDAYLRDEESIAIFVLGLMKDAIVDPIEDIIRKFLRNMHDQRRGEASRYMCVGKYSVPSKGNDDEEGGTNEEEEDLISDEDGDDDDEEEEDFPKLDNFSDIVRRAAYKAAPKGTPKSSLQRSTNGAERHHLEYQRRGKYDYSYLKVSGRNNIPAYIDAHYMSVSKPSLFQIKSAWEKLCATTNLVYTYKMANDKNGKPDYNLFPVQDPNIPKTPNPLVSIRADGVFVHADLLNPSSMDRDLLREAIESIQHRYTFRRKVVYGEQYDTLHPNLFGVLQMEPVDRTLNTRNSLYMNKESKKLLRSEVEFSAEAKNVRDIPVFFMDEDLDSRSCGERLRILGIIPTQDRIVALHPRALMKLLLRDERYQQYIPDSTTEYPLSYVNAEEKVQRRVQKNMQKRNLKKIARKMPEALSSHSRILNISEQEWNALPPLTGLDDVLREFKKEQKNNTLPSQPTLTTTTQEKEQDNNTSPDELMLIIEEEEEDEEEQPRCAAPALPLSTSIRKRKRRQKQPTSNGKRHATLPHSSSYHTPLPSVPITARS